MSLVRSDLTQDPSSSSGVKIVCRIHPHKRTGLIRFTVWPWCSAPSAGLDVVSVSTWLGVVPQLIARIDSTSGPVSSLIRRLLIKVSLNLVSCF